MSTFDHILPQCSTLLKIAVQKLNHNFELHLTYSIRRSPGGWFLVRMRINDDEGPILEKCSTIAEKVVQK